MTQSFYNSLCLFIQHWFRTYRGFINKHKRIYTFSVFVFFFLLGRYTYSCYNRYEENTCLFYKIDPNINNGTLLYITEPHKAVAASVSLPWEDGHWGNQFSHYWHARAIALFANANFFWVDKDKVLENLKDLNINFFLMYMPQNYSRLNYSPEFGVTRNRRQLNRILYQHFCHIKKEECMRPMGILYPHEMCITWNWITEMIHVDTQIALRQWSNRHNEEMPVIHDDDVYIFDRCGNDSYFYHEGYGPMGFQVYKNYAPKTTKNFILVHDPRTRVVKFCQRYRGYLKDYLHLHFPKAKVTQIENRSRDFYNFAALATAKVVFTESSSFSLLAVLANKNKIISCDFHGYGLDFITDLPENFIFAGNGLFVKNQKNWGFEFSTYNINDFSSDEDYSKLKHWLLNN